MEGHQQPLDFSESQPPTEENYMTYQNSSSSSASTVVSTELSLSSIFSSSSSSSNTCSRQYLGVSKINNTRWGKSSKPHNYKPPSSSSSITEKEKTSRFNDNNNNNNNNNNNSQCCWGYSTTLKLYEDPWKIKKVLTASDIGKLSRLLLSSDLMENLVVPVLGNCNNYEDQELLSTEGKAIRVWDVETMSMHELILKRWASFTNYVLIGDWTQDFVKRRALKKGDEIGLQWDSFNHCFNFSVLKRSSYVLGSD